MAPRAFAAAAALSACGSRALRLSGVSCCRAGQPALQLHADVVALQRVGSSRIRDQPRVSCADRWILYH